MYVDVLMYVDVKVLFFILHSSYFEAIYYLPKNFEYVIKEWVISRCNLKLWQYLWFTTIRQPNIIKHSSPRISLGTTQSKIGLLFGNYKLFLAMISVKRLGLFLGLCIFLLEVKT